MYEVKYMLDDCLEFYDVYNTVEDAKKAKLDLENKFKSDYGFEGVVIKEKCMSKRNYCCTCKNFIIFHMRNEKSDFYCRVNYNKEVSIQQNSCDRFENK